MSARDERWARLQSAGLATGGAAAGSAAAPWYIGAMLGFAAWLAALFLLFFLGLALEDVVRTGPGAVALGLGVTVATAFVLRRSGEHAFVSQLALAFSVAGQSLVLVGLLMDGGRSEAWRWLVFAAFEGALVVLVPHAAHRVLATLAGATAVLMTLSTMALGGLFLPLVLAAFVYAERQLLVTARDHRLWHALAIGLVVAALGGIVWSVVPELWSPRDTAPPGSLTVMHWISVLLLAAVAASVGLVLVRDAIGGRDAREWIAALALAVLAVLASPVPGVAAAVVVLLLAFANGQPALMALGALGLLGALGYYYLRLDATLLVKAGSLAAIGLALLVARFVARRVIEAKEPARA